MVTRVFFFLALLTATTGRAAPATWKATFDRDALSSYMTDDAGTGVAVVLAGKPDRDGKAALSALVAAVKASKGAKSVVKVPKAPALAKLDDQAIVSKLKTTKAARVLVLRVTAGQGAPATASLKFYDMDATLLASVDVTAGTAMAMAAAEAREADSASAAVEKTPSPAAEPEEAAESATAAADSGSSAPVEPVAEAGDPAGAEPVADAQDSAPAPTEYPTEPVDSGERGGRSGTRLMLEMGRHSTSQAVSNGGSTSATVDGAWALGLGVDLRYSRTQSVTLGYFRNGYAMPASSSMLFHGVEASWRYHVPIGDVDPFVDLGAGWVYLTSAAGASGFEVKSKASGINLALGLGANYHLLEFLSVGLVARYNLPAFTNLCVEMNGSETCAKPSSNMKDLAYGLTVAVDPFKLF